MEQTSTSENNKRIVKNTMMLYFRMLLLLVVGLYTSRKVLNGLGVVDYGIINVVSGFVAMFLMVSDSLSSGISRFLNVHIGKSEITELRSFFSSAALLQIVVSIIFVIVAETFGIWFLREKMVIPEDREFASEVVYQISVVSFVVNLLSVPYNAAIISHEKMSVLAWVSIYEAVMKLFVAMNIYYSPIDRMIWYSLLCLVVALTVRIIYGQYCIKHFAECKIKYKIDKSIIKEFCTYSGWNFIGCAMVVLRVQGGNVLINMFFGPVVNAAKGIANQVNSILHGFVFNFMVAMNPQITQSYTKKDYDYMGKLICCGAKFSFFIMLILSIPVIVETDFVLNVWLGSVPEHTVSFIRLIILYTLLETFGMPVTTAIMASGNIKNYEIMYGLLEALNLPIAIVLYGKGAIPEVILVINIIISQICLILKICYLNKLTGFSVKEFLFAVCAKAIIVAFIAMLIPLSIRYVLDYGCVRVAIVSITAIGFSIISIYYIGCSITEQRMIKEYVRRIVFRRNTIKMI